MTLWMIAVWTIVQGTLVVLILLYQGASIERYYNARLVDRSDHIGTDIAPVLPGPTDEEIINIAEDNAQFVMFEDFAIVVYDENGNPVASTDRPAPDFQAIRRSHSDDIARRTVFTGVAGFRSLPGSRASQRSVVRQIQGPQGQLYYALITTTDTGLRDLTSRLRGVMILVSMVGLIGAAVAAWIITGIATEPLKRILESMREMSPENIGQAADISGESEELNEVRRELEAMRARMDMGFRSQERFLSNVSHEIKTPISVLLTEMQTLSNVRDAPEEVRDFIESVGDELRRLGGMVESFLLLTRVRDGKPVHAKIDAYQVNELVLDAVESSTGIAEQYEVHLVPKLLEDLDDLDLTINGVPDLLRTMLDNLIRNAIRFSPEHERVIIAAARPDPETVEIEVRDHGTGIPAEIVDTIFDRFTQVDTEVRRGRGHGLGLEIAQGIAELHGGVIVVENCEDRGCRFTIRLPIGESPASSRVSGAAPDEEVENHADHGKQQDQ